MCELWLRVDWSGSQWNKKRKKGGKEVRLEGGRRKGVGGVF